MSKGEGTGPVGNNTVIPGALGLTDLVFMLFLISRGVHENCIFFLPPFLVQYVILLFFSLFFSLFVMCLSFPFTHTKSVGGLFPPPFLPCFSFPHSHVWNLQCMLEIRLLNTGLAILNGKSVDFRVASQDTGHL